jgi:ATP-binding protein involved in chromosome partitioning
VSTNRPADAILEPAATRVRDPKSGRSIWMAGLISDASLSDDKLELTLRTTREHSHDDRQRMDKGLRAQIAQTGWKGTIVIHHAVGAASAPAPAPAPAHQHDPVRGMSGPGMQPHGGPVQKKQLPGVRHVIAVASGKGGVGKSTVATNLAVALRRQGLRVGMMDADIYGPSLPTMLGAKGKPFANDDQKIIPLEAHGIKCMSIGFLVDEDEPIIWRGPMVMGVVRQFLQDVDWSPLDVLVIDLPPGTGDAQLTMIQAVDLSGAVIVTTPQKVAVLDAVRGVEMFRKLEVPVLGVVENMAWIDVPGGQRMTPFGEGGGQATADRFGVPLLAQVPLVPEIRAGGDEGSPAALRDSAASAPFLALAEQIAATLAD